MKRDPARQSRPRKWTNATAGQFMRFAALGVLSFGLGLGISALLHELLGLRQELAVGVSLAALLATNFWVARLFIFQSQGDHLSQMGRFVVVSAAMRGVEYLCFVLLLRVFGLNYLLALTAAMALSNCLKFVLYGTVVFRDP